MVESLGNTQRHAARQPRRRRRSYYLSVERRAVVAASLVKDHGWAAKQAAGLFCVNTHYLSLARNLSEADRLRLMRGDISLSQLANRRQVTDAKVDRIVARIGSERIMAALDRATRPAAPSASTPNDDAGPAEWWMEMMNAPHAVAAE
jgi:hypothetical protein